LRKRKVEGSKQPFSFEKEKPWGKRKPQEAGESPSLAIRFFLKDLLIKRFNNHKEYNTT